MHLFSVEFTVKNTAGMSNIIRGNKQPLLPHVAYFHESFLFLHSTV